MFQKIRITAVSLVAAVACLLSSTMTLSYFVDTDAKSNSFTVGNISTSLSVYKDEDNNPLNPSDYTLVDNLNIPFYLQAENKGNVPVYQRFRVVIPKALASEITLDLPEMNNNCTVKTNAENTCSNDDYKVTFKPNVDNKYAEYYIESKAVLAVGEKTVKWPVTGIVVDGLDTEEHESLLTCEGDDSNNCVLGISAYSDAIQTAGFSDVSDAFKDFPETY